MVDWQPYRCERDPCQLESALCRPDVEGMPQRARKHAFTVRGFADVVVLIPLPSVGSFFSRLRGSGASRRPSATMLKAKTVEAGRH
jgi:hypothetical protein